MHAAGIRFEQAGRAVTFAATVMLRNWFWMLLIFGVLLIGSSLLGSLGFIVLYAIFLPLAFFVGNLEQFQLPARQFRFRWYFPG